MEKVEVYKCPGGAYERDLTRAKARHLEALEKRSGVTASKPISFTAGLFIVEKWNAVRDIVDPGAGAQAGRIYVLEKRVTAQDERLEKAEELLCDVLTNRKGPEHDPFADIAAYLSEHRPDIYPPTQAKPDGGQGKKYPFPYDGSRNAAVGRITRALEQTPFSRAVATLIRYIPFSHLPDAVNDIEKEYRK